MANYEDKLVDITQQASTDVVGVIASRLKAIGDGGKADAITQKKDLKEISKIMKSTTKNAVAEVENVYEQASKDNDKAMKPYYEARGLDSAIKSLSLTTIKAEAIKGSKRQIEALAKTSAFDIDGKMVPIRTAYLNTINYGIYAMKNKDMDYKTAIRGAVKKLADSGLRVVDFESGYHRRLDSQVRMNILDGIRLFNMDYRMRQGAEFGADGIEVSSHGLPAPDHQDIDGQQYSLKDFDNVNNGLDRPIGTCNCMHSIFPIILGISKPAYTSEYLRKNIEEANKIRYYKGKNGKILKCSGYEATQKQRQQELIIRQLKDIRNAYEVAGLYTLAEEYNRKIKEQMAYYKKMSSDLGLKPRAYYI